MKYTTNDLSKILNVSTNTIRRYEEKGFLHAVRNESNGYREFGSIDVEKLMYTSKYRKFGFSQEEILDIFSQTILQRKDRYESKIIEIEKEIEHLQSLKHMLKDDMQLMSRLDDFADEIKEYKSSSMYYILYQKNGNVSLGKNQTEAIHGFLEVCTEYEYIYHFEKDDVLNGRLVYGEGIAANELMVDKYGISKQSPLEHYSAQMCLMRVIRIPLDFSDREMMSREEIVYQLFGQFSEYMEQNQLELINDVIGIKLGMSQEDGKDWQYVLMHVPVKSGTEN